MRRNLSTILQFKNGKKRPEKEGNIPVYGGNGILGYTNAYNNENCLIIGRVGAYCGSVYLEKNICWVSDNAIAATIREHTDIVYAYYLLKLQRLNERRIGTSQPLLTQSILNNIETEILSYEKQVKVGRFLDRIDNKIDLNKRINKNLEQQVFALFDLEFPAVTSGNKAIGDYITPKRGKNLLSRDAVFGATPVVAGGLEPSTYHNVANTSSPVLTISASGANSGFVRLWNIPVWSSDSSYIDSSMTPYVYFWYAMLKKRQKEIYDSQTGSAQPHIYPQHIAVMPVAELDNDAIASYTERVTPFFQMIGSNVEESNRLASTRDALLPKLMSGELDVSELDF